MVRPELHLLKTAWTKYYVRGCGSLLAIPVRMGVKAKIGLLYKLISKIHCFSYYSFNIHPPLVDAVIKLFYSLYEIYTGLVYIARKGVPDSNFTEYCPAASRKEPTNSTLNLLIFNVFNLVREKWYLIFTSLIKQVCFFMLIGYLYEFCELLTQSIFLWSDGSFFILICKLSGISWKYFYLMGIFVGIL